MDQGLLICLAAMAAGSFLQGFAGFGFSMMALPFLSMVLDLRQAVVICSLANASICALHLWRMGGKVRLREARDLIIGGVLGLPVGVLILKVSPSSVIEIILACTVLAFTLLSVSNLVKLSELNPRWGYVFGLLAGALGAAVSIPAPPVLIYSYLRNWDKDSLKATMSAFMFAVAFIASLLYWLSGLANNQTYLLFAKLLPALFTGYLLGHWLFFRLDSELFRKFVLLVLTALAIMILYRNLA